MSEHSDEPRKVEDDGLYVPEIKLHSLDKIRIHNRYARVFATAIQKKWQQRAYVGLYAGAGYARVAGTRQIVETSALSVLRQPAPFTDYIYVDNNPECVTALASRITTIGVEAKTTVIARDVNDSVDEIKRALPNYSTDNRLLTFCFVDPFDVQFQFKTIRALSTFRMDFLILLMLGVDARRNFKLYLNDPSSSRIGDLIDCPNWREEFREGENVIRFLLRRFDQSMQKLGYLSAADDVHPVKVTGMGVMQYFLAFYSKHELGQKIWRDARNSILPQMNLGL